ncbi:MAG: polyprenyl synthetase family protein [Candidatus Bathyarchaeia archaeon]|nr:polyprenyl synthetase family protein [Candidatus Bathyarchaeota archaeon]
MNLNDELTQYSFNIEKKIENELNLLITETFHPFIKKLYSTLKEFILRKGKRIASYTTLITYKGYKKRENKKIFDICVSVEFYRHSILIHDDLVDEDEYRRGGETIHVSLTKERDERFGRGEAIFLGNIAYALALNKILNAGFKIETTIKAASLFSKAYKDVNESQALDLLFERENPEVNEWYIMASKRAASLFKLSILLGAIFGEAVKKDLKLLEEAAVNIGYAFDIQDDIIDLYASKEIYGRVPGRDLILKKKPLYMVYALRMVNHRDLEKIKKYFNFKEVNPNETLNVIREIVEKTGALKAAKDKMQLHIKKAKTLIQKTSLTQEAKNSFNSLINYISESLEWYT